MHKVNPHTKLCFGIIVLCLLNIVTGIALSSDVANAESTSSASSTASVTVPEACTMTSTNNAPHTATISPNTYSGASGSEYQNGIGKTTLTATCNDDNGFAIYAIGYTGNSYDSENHNKLVGQSTNVAINTAVYTSGDTTSSWSMKVNKINDSTVSYNPQNMSILDSFDSWHIVPATYTKVAEYHANTGSSTTDTTLGAKVETTYAAYIAENQAADTYIGQVKYTMVHPYMETPLQPVTCPSGKICYNANGNNVIGTMGQPTISSSETFTTLLASNFSRQGYGFAGWSNKFDYATNPNQEGIKFYGPQEDITFTAGQYTGTNPGLSLYAIWIKSQGYLQDTNKVNDLCGTSPSTGTLTTAPTDGTANLASVSALTDQRDNETYAIARLADSNCWMIENLRLESTNSDNSTGALAQGYGKSVTYGDFSGLADAENANFTATTGSTDTTTMNSLYYAGTQEGTATINISQTNYAGYRMPRYNNWNHQASSANRPYNPTSNSATNSATKASMYSYGNYYTWHAAIADTSYYFNEDHNTTSICPKGWRLPKGAQSTINMSFGKLSVELGGPTDGASANTISTPTGTKMSKVFRSYPNNFTYSGYFNGASTNNQGSNGYYSSSTADSFVYSARNLYIDVSSAYPGTNSLYKSIGQSIRCLNSS